MSRPPEHGTPPVHPHACGENDNRIDPRSTMAPDAVHPHACGENYIKDDGYYEGHGFGTPPRLWGKRNCYSKCGSSRQTAAVHPHACGENSPRDAYQPSERFHSVHPHACGENGVAPESKYRFCVFHVGTPPRLWGKRYCGIEGTPPRLWGSSGNALRFISSRYTPTPVGKTLTRGCLTGYALERYTPTPVGKTNWCSRRSIPRYTPTHYATWRISLRRSGTPPRLWGKRRLTAIARSHGGTPPRLWGLSWYGSAPIIIPVHPHACGENPSVIKRKIHRTAFCVAYFLFKLNCPPRLLRPATVA